MNAAKNPQAALLCAKSAEDEAVLDLPVHDAIFTFHAQQAIEKLLKAVIAAHGEVYPYTHNIQLLLDQIERLGVSLPEFDLPLHVFTKYGVAVRYDHVPQLAPEDRLQFRKVVGDLRRCVLKKFAE